VVLAVAVVGEPPAGLSPALAPATAAADRPSAPPDRYRAAATPAGSHASDRQASRRQAARSGAASADGRSAGDTPAVGVAAAGETARYHAAVHAAASGTAALCRAPGDPAAFDQSRWADADAVGATGPVAA